MLKDSIKRVKLYFFLFKALMKLEPPDRVLKSVGLMFLNTQFRVNYFLKLKCLKLCLFVWFNFYHIWNWYLLSRFYRHLSVIFLYYWFNKRRRRNILKLFKPLWKLGSDENRLFTYIWSERNYVMHCTQSLRFRIEFDGLFSIHSALKWTHQWFEMDCRLESFF